MVPQHTNPTQHRELQDAYLTPELSESAMTRIRFGDMLCPRGGLQLGKVGVEKGSARVRPEQLPKYLLGTTPHR